MLAEIGSRLTQRPQAITEISGFQVEMAKAPEQVELEIVAAPCVPQFFIGSDRLGSCGLVEFQSSSVRATVALALLGRWGPVSASSHLRSAPSKSPDSSATRP